VKTVLALAIGLTLVAAMAAVAGAPETERLVSDRWQVVSDVSQLEMINRHQPMMEQMRVSATPQMGSQMAYDPMWTTLDADMVTLMEQNQAQIDRMLARR
jgi:hypothetical protein